MILRYQDNRAVGLRREAYPNLTFPEGTAEGAESKEDHGPRGEGDENLPPKDEVGTVNETVPDVSQETGKAQISARTGKATGPKR